MKKVLILLIAAAVAVGFSIWGIVAYNMDKGQSSKVEIVVVATKGGDVSVEIDGETSLITEQNSSSFQLKKDTIVKVSATAKEQYKFNKWTADTMSISSDKLNYSFKCYRDVKLTGNFVRSEATITVVDEKDDTFTENFNFDLSTNLLDTLNDKYTAKQYYCYVYKLSTGEEVTASTTVVTNVTITRCEKPIEYSVKFMDGERQIGTTQYFNAENKQTVTISVPDPTIPGYTTSWPEPAFDVKTCEYENQVINLNKTIINYHVTFVYDGTQHGEFSYNVENRNDPATVQIPDAPTTDEGYEIKWNSFDITNKLENLEVGATKTQIEYVVRFMNGEEEVGRDTYTIENRTTKQINVPEVPVIKGYDTSWEDFDITTGELRNIDVNLNKDIKTYTITFTGADGVNPIEYTILTYETVTLPEVPSKTGYLGYWDKTLEELDLANLGDKEVAAFYLAKYTLDINVQTYSPEIYVKEVDGVNYAYNVVGGVLTEISTLSDYCASIYNIDGNNPYKVGAEESQDEVFTLEEFTEKLTAELTTGAPHMITILYY